MALVGDKKLFRAVIVISQKISFLPEVIPPIDIYIITNTLPAKT